MSYLMILMLASLFPIPVLSALVLMERVTMRVK
jgi:hypothetical protein